MSNTMISLIRLRSLDEYWVKKVDLDLDAITPMIFTESLSRDLEESVKTAKEQNNIGTYFNTPKIAFITYYGADYAAQEMKKGIKNIATIRTIRNVFASGLLNTTVGGMKCPRDKVFPFTNQSVTLRELGVDDKYAIVYMTERTDEAHQKTQFKLDPLEILYFSIIRKA